MIDLIPEEIAKLRWAASHDHVKIDDFDTVGDDLCKRGYLDYHDAGYVDWYGYWATISLTGIAALCKADRRAQGIEAEGQDPQGLGAKHESPVANGEAP